jgi:polysaccharide export outer membrane protein
MFLRSSFLLALFTAIALAGCGGGKSPESMIPSKFKSSGNDEIKKLNTRILTRSSTDFSVSDYRIGPGDLIEVKVYEAQDLSTVARVNSRGTVTYPLLGEVEVGSLTVQEAEQKLRDLLAAKYVKDPHVSVFIREYRSKNVAVVGAVNKPGNYELLNQGRLLDALALAGGLTENAGKMVYVTKYGTGEQVAIDLDELLMDGNTGLNIPVSMGDTVFVPEAGVFYVNGAVKRPGEYRIKDQVTVSKAIGMAGGLVTGAKSSEVKLIRFGKNGEREMVSVDLKAIERGEQEDIALQDQDVVFVDQNAIIAFFQTLRLGFFFPPFSLSGSAPQ